MFSKQIVDSDDFLDMPLSAQALYLHLLVRADDDGFTNGVKKVMRMIGARDDDLKVLIGKRFVLMFESGVLVIKHWLIHNSIRKDRYKPTVHTEEKALIEQKDNEAYTFKKEPLNGLDSTWQPNGNQLAPQVSIGKVSIVEDNKKEKPKKKTTARFIKPTIEQLNSYKQEKGYKWDVEAFYDYYQTNGWKVGKNAMKDWKAAMRNWNRRNGDYNGNSKPKSDNPYR
jgi:hypothetical protein